MTAAAGLGHRCGWFSQSLQQIDGSTRKVWTLEATTRGSYRLLTGREVVEHGLILTPRQPKFVRVRATADTRRILTSWKMRDETGIDHAVRAVMPAEDRAWIDVLVESGVTP